MRKSKYTLCLVLGLVVLAAGSTVRTQVGVLS